MLIREMINSDLLSLLLLCVFKLIAISLQPETPELITHLILTHWLQSTAKDICEALLYIPLRYMSRQILGNTHWQTIICSPIRLCQAGVT